MKPIRMSSIAGEFTRKDLQFIKFVEQVAQTCMT
jgi:hypothetical protein